ncbi:hypothetical protein FR483_n758L [Paramecium bursaria Chlorella virus FR483]|uniref:Uncharacterized protein n758L n=1 Tax=Paramecium bursaria Chlorella virus FR483 TaxID=399781 RepID=A7J8B2_PBCVF|nr:hypothetical protein FR483_n758L [Paramecium bursaria Chlorella virus FR483]ABT16043.1 hypothetical protein FR483_n758L [Paramecium bursaria Chlorella virus FR483]
MRIGVCGYSKSFTKLRISTSFPLKNTLLRMQRKTSKLVSVGLDFLVLGRLFPRQNWNRKRVPIFADMRSGSITVTGMILMTAR